MRKPLQATVIQSINPNNHETLDATSGMVSHVTCPVSAGLTDFDAYRSEQAEWLRQLVRTREYRKARYRIAISHFPMVMAQQWKDEKVSILQERFKSSYGFKHRGKVMCNDMENFFGINIKIIVCDKIPYGLYGSPWNTRFQSQ